MNTQRISRIVGGVVAAAALSVVVMVAWSNMNRSDPSPSSPLTEGPVLGDLTGYVGRVDQKARTVEVSEDRLGQRPVTMTVTDDTSITVRGQPRGLRDLTKDLPVRAFYEVRNDVRYVTRIQVVTENASPPSPAARQSATFNTASAPAPAPPIAPAPPFAPAPVAEAAAPPPQTVSAARPVATDAGDGSAAVDWLLSRRR
ncbi:MAG: hypothetical protein DME04_12860 [Candidatus Rokuibacteriota bacterium]|nr:MAG: hypothetical protein DME04_12860 [Candidatus Rokubacteria bacterium]